MGCTNDSTEKHNNKSSKSKKRKQKYREENNIEIMGGCDDLYDNNEEKNKEDEKKSDSNKSSIYSDKDSVNNSSNSENNNADKEDEESDSSKKNEEENFLSMNHNNNNDIIRNFEPYLQSKNDENFNFPEVKKNIYVGKGLKRMKGYISNISKEDLIKKRESFWGTRVEGNQQTWNFLKEICEMPECEENDLTAMLQAYDLVPYNNCINVSYDALGGLYEIPNYCIHDPTEYDLPEAKQNKPDQKKICFKARYGAKQMRLKCSNYSSVKKVKGHIAKKMESKVDKIRLFFFGKEMKNDMQLWNYSVDNDVIVIIMISP